MWAFLCSNEAIELGALRVCILALAIGPLVAQNPAPAGDPARGKALFEGKAECSNCHRVNGNGSRMGPDLSEMGLVRRGAGLGPPIDTAAAGDASALERAILEPDAAVAPANRFVRVVTKDGAIITGRLLNYDSFTVQLLEAQAGGSQGKLRSYIRSDLREFTVVTKSLMPSYKGKLSAQEVADLVSYLLSLKGLASQ